MAIDKLLNTLPQAGVVRWIGIRPGRRQPIQVVERIHANCESGLIGDRYAGRPGGKRQVTLIQWEHLAVMASLLNQNTLDPALLRRNIAVSGINLLALKNKQFRVGDALLECTGLCHPCSYMEEVFGPGGYNIVRGHGGITARVLNAGDICLGDRVEMTKGSNQTNLPKSAKTQV